MQITTIGLDLAKNVMQVGDANCHWDQSCARSSGEQT